MQDRACGIPVRDYPWPWDIVRRKELGEGADTEDVECKHRG